MLRQFRKQLIEALWENYCCLSDDARIINAALAKRQCNEVVLDHFAVIDLPSPHSGIPTLKKIFTLLGYEVRGDEYLAKKQNDFSWLAEKDCAGQNPNTVLPQIVVADFRLHEMPEEIAAIIRKYSAAIPALDFNRIENEIREIEDGNTSANRSLLAYLLNYFQGRSWPLPSYTEFSAVRSFNELLAWVLIFGRRPNHFTYSAHLLDGFANFEAFNDYLEHELGLKLNTDGGKIKGSKAIGLAQSAAIEKKATIQLADKSIELPCTFVEFVWRYRLAAKTAPSTWGDYFANFIPQQADKIIQSLYVPKEKELSAQSC